MKSNYSTPDPTLDPPPYPPPHLNLRQCVSYLTFISAVAWSDVTVNWAPLRRPHRQPNLEPSAVDAPDSASGFGPSCANPRRYRHLPAPDRPEPDPYRHPSVIRRRRLHRCCSACWAASSRPATSKRARAISDWSSARRLASDSRRPRLSSWFRSGPTSARTTPPAAFGSGCAPWVPSRWQRCCCPDCWHHWQRRHWRHHFPWQWRFCCGNCWTAKNHFLCSAGMNCGAGGHGGNLDGWVAWRDGPTRPTHSDRRFPLFVFGISKFITHIHRKGFSFFVEKRWRKRRKGASLRCWVLRSELDV